MPRHKQVYVPGYGGQAKAIRTAQDEAMPKTSWWAPKKGEDLDACAERLRADIPKQQSRMAHSRFGTIIRTSLGTTDAPSPFSAYRQGLKRSLGL